MAEFPETRDSLILQVKDPGNREAWEEFAQIYRPVIRRIAIARGLQDADAQDLAQHVLIAVAGAIGRWEKKDSSTRFRHWLRRIARNAILNALTRRPADLAAGGSSMIDLLDQEPQPDGETEKLIELECRRQQYLHAAEVVRVEVQPDTWAAFEMTVFDNVSIESAAAKLNKTVGVIYAARSRVMKRLRDVLQSHEEEQR